MRLQEKIQEDLKNAMLQKNEAIKSLLRVIIGEMNRNKDSKELLDEKVISIIKGMVENAKLTNKLNEIPILEKYLPKQLSDGELNINLSTIIRNNNFTIKDLGKIMNLLKEQYAGQYDGKTASVMIKNILA